MNVICDTTRPNGVRVIIEDYDNPDGSIIFKVKSYYSDGSSRDCEFFGIFDSALSCYNRTVDQENKENK